MINYKVTQSNKTISILLAMFVIFIYYPVFNFPFINLDDFTAIVNNPDIKNGLNWESIKWSFTTTYYDYWHPLTWISHCFDWSLYGSNAGGHHLSNVILHLFNTIILFHFIFNLTKNKINSTFGAILFAIHPMHIESVAWIVERKDVLSMFWALLTLLFYTVYKNSNQAKFYIYGVIFYILCLMTKPMFVTLPFVLLLIDFTFSNETVWTQIASIKRFSKLFTNKIIFFTLSFSSAYFTYITVKSINAIGSFDNLPLINRIYNAINSYYEFLINFFVPYNVSIYHPYHNIDKITTILLPIGIVIFSISLILIIYRKNNLITIGVLWFLGSLVPVIGIIQTGSQSYADRFAYFPYIGLYISLISILSSSFKKHKNVSLILFCVFLSINNRYQLSFWESTEKLFRRSLQMDDSSLLLHTNLGQHYMLKNEIDSAKYHFEKAVIYDNQYPIGLYNLGILKLNNSKYTEAIEYFKKTISADSNYYDAYLTAAECYIELGNDTLTNLMLDKSKPHLYKSIKKNEHNYRTHYTLGKIHYFLNNIDSTVFYYKKSLSQNPDQWNIYNDLGLIYLNNNNSKLAMELFYKSIEFNQDKYEPWHNILLVTNKNKQYKETIKIASYALNKFPNNIKILHSRANAYYAINDRKKCQQDLNKIHDLDSNVIISMKD